MANISKSHVIYNNGDRMARALWWDNGDRGFEYILRKYTDLTREQFLITYPVTLRMGLFEGPSTDAFFKDVEAAEDRRRRK